MPWILIIPLIILLLPIVDFFWAVAWLFDSPLWAGLYFSGGVVVGVVLMTIGRLGAYEVMRQLRQNSVEGSALMSGFSAVWMMGVLLAFPGVMSDVAAVLLLMFVWFGRGRVSAYSHSAHSGEDILQVDGEIIDDAGAGSDGGDLDSAAAESVGLESELAAGVKSGLESAGGVKSGLDSATNPHRSSGHSQMGGGVANSSGDAVGGKNALRVKDSSVDVTTSVTNRTTAAEAVGVTNSSTASIATSENSTATSVVDSADSATTSTTDSLTSTNHRTTNRITTSGRDASGRDD